MQNRNLKESYKGYLLFSVAILLVWILVSLAAYRVWIHGADHRDFYPRWAGARLLLFDKMDLYAEETTQEIQKLLYGTTLPPDRDQQGFAYPAQLVVTLLPLWLIPDVEVATAIWVGLSAILLLVTYFLLNRVNPALPSWAGFIFLFWYYTLLVLFQGQITALIIAAIGVAYWFYHRENDLWAGISLSLALVKPELVIFPVFALLVFTLPRRRYGFTIGFVVASAILFLASLLVAGWWLPGWIGAIDRYAAYAKVTLPLLDMWSYGNSFGILILVIALSAIILTRKTEAALFSASIPLGLLVLPQTLIWNLSLLTIPLSLYWYGRARYLIVLLWLLGWFWAFLPIGPQFWNLQSIIFPVLTLVIISYTSRQTQNDHHSVSIPSLG